MQLPIVAPAPIVTAHADIFRDLFETRCQLRPFPHYLTGLLVLDNKRLANIARCGLASADTTTLSRFFSAAPWFQDRVHDRRLTSLLQQTPAVRGPKADGALILDDTLCAPVGSLCDYVDRHAHHGDAPYPLAHHPVTRHDVNGPVRFPVDLRLSRRYEACPRGEECVRSPCPARPLPTPKKARARLHKAGEPVILQAPDFEKFQQQLRTKRALGIALLESAIAPKVPWSVLVFDRWALAAALVSMARYHTKDGMSWLKKPRNLETKRCVLKDAAGTPVPLAGPHSAVEDLVPL